MIEYTLHECAGYFSSKDHFSISIAIIDSCAPRLSYLASPEGFITCSHLNFDISHTTS